MWNPVSDPYCPVFRVKDILTAAGITTFAKNEVIQGAVITIGIRYTCDLDKGGVCPPQFTFTRTDDPNDPVRKNESDRVKERPREIQREKQANREREEKERKEKYED